MKQILQSLNPFRKLPNSREVWAWGMYDLANQSFTLLIITLLFSLFFKQVVVTMPAFEELASQAGIASETVAQYWQADADGRKEIVEGMEAGDAAAIENAFHRAGAKGDARWAIVHSTSFFIVVLLSPMLGALADARAWRKEFLIATGVICAALTIGLGWIGAGALAFAALLYIPANVCYQLGENFLASFLPSISTRKTIGRISALGWSMGYVGALLLLIAVAIAMPVFGIQQTKDWPPLFVFAGAWFLIFMVPSILFLRDDRKGNECEGSAVLAAFGRLARTAREATRFHQLALFLVAFLIYGFGIQVIVAFASVIAIDLGFKQEQLVLFVLQLTVVAGVTAFATSAFQDRIGTKRTIILFLIIWIASALGLLGIQLASEPQPWMFWVVGNGIGLGLGGAGTASRAMVARFTPKHRSAEFFGLWGFTYKLAGGIGVLSFGAVKAGLGGAAALGLLTAFFVIGLVLVLFLNERAGVYAACVDERLERAA